MPRWTERRLLSAMMRRLRDPQVALSPKVLDDCRAHIQAESAKAMRTGRGPREISVDPMQIGWIQAVIHELLHDALEPCLAPIFSRDMIETTVEAHENALALRVLGDDAETSRWRRAIERKLKAGA